MDTSARVKMVSSMEYIVRHLNNENIFMDWLSLGVADGDIVYGDMNPDAEDLDYYLEDDNFADLMQLFIDLIARASKSGGLYCDKILSKYTD